MVLWVGTSRYFSALTALRELLWQNDEKISPSFKPYGFFENTVRSTGSFWKSNNFMKFFSKKYTLYGVYISSNIDFRLNLLAFNETKTYSYKSEVVQTWKEFLFRF